MTGTRSQTHRVPVGVYGSLVDVIVRIVKHRKELDRSTLDLQTSYLPQAAIAAAINSDQ